MLIDTHCHLNFKAFNADLTEVVRRARRAGVKKMIVPGTDLTSSQRAIEIARQFPGVCYAAIGIHPHHAQDPHLKVNQQLKNQLEKLIAGESDKIVAIGEIGLDYYQYRKTKYENNLITEEIKQKQMQLLTLQLDLAVIHNLPVILHCREAWSQLIQTIANYSKSSSSQVLATYNNSRISHQNLSKNEYQLTPAFGNTPSVKPAPLYGVCHCFSGSEADLQAILTLGYYVGFDGNITYNKSYAKIVASTPLQQLLIETDSPYLTPVPYRGQRNEPAYLTFTAQAVANYHQTSFSQIEKITNNNALKLFHLY